MRSVKNKCLALLALLFILTGFNEATEKTPQYILDESPDLEAHFKLLTYNQWGWVFLAVGLISLLSAIARKPSVGYSLMMLLGFFWTALYFISFLDTGYWKALTVSAPSFIIQIGLFWVLSRSLEYDCVKVGGKNVPVFGRES